MTISGYTYAGLSKSFAERELYCEIHACPACGCRAQTSNTDWVRIMRDGAYVNVAKYDVECASCRVVRKFLFDEDLAGEARFRRMIEAKYLAVGLTSMSEQRAPADVIRFSCHVGPPGEPSLILQPHELIAELVRYEDRRPEDRRLVEYAAFRTAITETYAALRCAYALQNFLADGAVEIPDALITSKDGHAVRSRHPERFQRPWIEAQVQHWEGLQDQHMAEETERKSMPASDPRSREHAPQPKVSHLEPLSRVSLKAHEWWLDGQVGERLEAKGVDATGGQFSTRLLSSATFEDVTFDRADFSFAKLQATAFTRVSAKDADFGSALLAGASIDASDFSRSAMPLAQFGDATISGTTFEGARLERSTWYRAKITRCSFRGADLRSTAFDHCVVVDCDFRGAVFTVLRGLLGTMSDAVFSGCDFRDTEWTDVELFRARFVDCKFGGARGTPKLSETVFEGAETLAR